MGFVFNKMKRQQNRKEKIFENPASGKGLMSKICKEHIQIKMIMDRNH